MHFAAVWEGKPPEAQVAELCLTVLIGCGQVLFYRTRRFPRRTHHEEIVERFPHRFPHVLVHDREVATQVLENRTIVGVCVHPTPVCRGSDLRRVTDEQEPARRL